MVRVSWKWRVSIFSGSVFASLEGFSHGFSRKTSPGVAPSRVECGLQRLGYTTPESLRRGKSNGRSQ